PPIYPLSLHDALPIFQRYEGHTGRADGPVGAEVALGAEQLGFVDRVRDQYGVDLRVAGAGPVSQLLGRGDGAQPAGAVRRHPARSEEHTSELQSLAYL